MAEKAILITTANQDMLASRYNLEKWEYEDRIPVGFYLITEFGNEETFETVTPAKFAATFVENGKIDHGFIDVSRL